MDEHLSKLRERISGGEDQIDPLAIADAILELARDAGAARAMGARARAFAEAHFGIDRLDRALEVLLAHAR